MLLVVDTPAWIKLFLITAIGELSIRLCAHEIRNGQPQD